MDERRDNDRIAFASLGMLGKQREKLTCKLENISAGGALLSSTVPVPGTLHEGDVVEVKTILLSPVELRCRVARIDGSLIAVQFLER